MDQSGKICWHHWKEPLISKLATFESYTSYESEDIAAQSCENLQTFVWWGHVQTRLCASSQTKGFFSLASHANLVPRSPTAKRKPHGRVRLARKTLTPRFTDSFTDFEEKTDCFAVYVQTSPHHTNVCKFSQLSAAISSFVFNKLLLNSAIFLIFSRVDRFSLSCSC